MKSEAAIRARLEAIENEIDGGGDFRSLETERDTLEWVLEDVGD